MRGYPWPIMPFDQPHPVRSVVGDPRTTFTEDSVSNPLDGRGSFTFHNGVDIDARNGTPVYPVVSGTVLASGSRRVFVKARDGLDFLYQHLIPAVRVGETVTVGRTLLGRVDIWAQELHFSVLTPGHVFNPLLPGGLTPYRDTTKPTVVQVLFRDARGQTVGPYFLHGRVEIIAQAYDTPMPPIPDGRFPLSPFIRDDFGVAPAAVAWKLTKWHGPVVVPETTAVDFRRGKLPRRRFFWRTYARGTYANRPVIDGLLYEHKPGKFLFRLTPSLFDTRVLPDGLYIVTVTATDARGNKGTFSQPLEISNQRRVPAATSVVTQVHRDDRGLGRSPEEERRVALLERTKPDVRLAGRESAWTSSTSAASAISPGLPASGSIASRSARARTRSARTR
jgi:hypothetical protein